MIDEELYQLAAEELDSDRRRQHIWARACILASNDHDEARYLYTNLRVEEMLTERRNQTSTPVENDYESPARESLPQSAPETDPHLMGDYKPSPLDQTNINNHLRYSQTAQKSGILHNDQTQHDDPEESFLDSRGFDESLNNTGYFNNTVAFNQADSPPLSADADAAGPPRKSGVQDSGYDQTTQMMLTEEELSSIGQQQSKAHADTAGNTSDLTTSNIKVLDEHASELDELLADAEYIPDYSLNDLSGSEDMQWLDDDRVIANDTASWKKADREAPFIYDQGALTQELARQALDLDLGQPVSLPSQDHSASEQDATGDNEDLQKKNPPRVINAVDSSVKPEKTHQPSVKQTARSATIQNQMSPSGSNSTSTNTPPLTAGSQSAPPPPGAVNQPPRQPGHKSPSATTSSKTPSSARRAATTPGSSDTAQPINLTTEYQGQPYAVYQRGSKVKAIATGSSWLALFFTLPFLLIRGLFGVALAYILVWVVALCGFATSALAWANAGASASPWVQFATISFALIAFVGLIYLPLRRANHWRCQKLERHGYKQVAIANGHSARRAIEQARRQGALKAANR